MVERPLILYAAAGGVAVLAVLFLYGYRQRARLIIPSLDIDDIRRAHAVRILSMFVAVFLLVAALWIDSAGVSEWHKTGLIAYACDESRSMGARDDAGISRIDRCKQLILALDQFPYSVVAAYGFTNGAASHSSFSKNHHHFARTVEQLIAIEAVPGIGSAIGLSLESLIGEVARKRKEFGQEVGMVVILSDGENTGSSKEILGAVSLARQHSIKVVTVGIGGEDAVPIPIWQDGNLIGYEKDARGENFLTRLRSSTLELIADESGGMYAREDEAEKARAFIEKELAFEEVKVKDAQGPFASYILLAGLVPLLFWIKYSSI